MHLWFVVLYVIGETNLCPKSLNPSDFGYDNGNS